MAEQLARIHLSIPNDEYPSTSSGRTGERALHVRGELKGVRGELKGVRGELEDVQSELEDAPVVSELVDVRGELVEPLPLS